MTTALPPPTKGTHDDEELVPVDDAIIGKAFRWSIVVIAAVGAALGLTIWRLNRPVVVEPPRQVAFVAPMDVEQTADVPDAPFTDVTAESGIDFVHDNGAAGDKLLPETMGAGCAFLDYDGDGDQDLLLVNSTRWPEQAAAGGPSPTHRLYRNDGAGRFDDVTVASGLDVSFYGMGAAVGDYDNDGDADVFITAVGENHLFRNEGGRFHDVTDAARVGGDPAAWSTSAAFFDYDNDGDLDLFVCNYIRWSRDIDFAVDYRLVGVGRAFGAPTNFQGAFDYLYRNEGDGTFSDVSENAGLHVANDATGVPIGKALALAVVDVDQDGFIDVLVANDTTRKFLFRNKGDGTFEEIGTEAGVAFDGMGNATGAMGADAVDFRNDNTLGIAVGNFANEMTSLYVSQDEFLQFTDAAIAEGVGSASRGVLTFGLFFFDFDLDGRLDLFQCNGHIEEEINKVQPSQHYRQPAQLFWNAGPQRRSCFTEVPQDRLGDLATPIVGRGAAYADVDADGDLDVLLTQTGGSPLLLRNDQSTGHHWLRLKLVGTHCNRDAIGAWIELRSGGVTQRRHVMPTRSYLSQVELPVTFGLGEAETIDTIRVTWPDRSVENVKAGPVDREIVVTQTSDAPKT